MAWPVFFMLFKGGYHENMSDHNNNNVDPDSMPGAGYG
jgi:hypothetical protein